MNETNPVMTDCFSGTALKEIVNRLQNELLKEDEKLVTLITTEDGSDGVWVTKDGYGLCIDRSKYYSSNESIVKIFMSEIKEYQDRDGENRNLENDITSLKKRIKHSKNPMEKKRFEKQLNIAYKRRKSDKRGISL